MTLEEIIAALKADENLRKGMAAHMAGTEEGKEILTNFAKADWESKIGNEVSSIHKRYDDDVFEILGVRKEGDQKTYDFIKAKLAELKTLKESGSDSDKVKTLELEIKNLKDSGDHNSHWKKTHEEAADAWDLERQGFVSKIEKSEKDSVRSLIGSDFDKGLAGIKFIDGIPQEAIDALVNQSKQKVLDNAKVVGNNVVYLKEDGSPWLNDIHKQITSGEIMKNVLKGVIKEGKDSSRGSGADQNLGFGEIIKIGEGDNAKKSITLDSSKFSTKNEFTNVVREALTKKGVVFGSAEYNEISDAAYAQYGVKEMKTE